MKWIVRSILSTVYKHFSIQAFNWQSCDLIYDINCINRSNGACVINKSCRHSNSNAMQFIIRRAGRFFAKLILIQKVRPQVFSNVDAAVWFSICVWWCALRVATAPPRQQNDLCARRVRLIWYANPRLPRLNGCWCAHADKARANLQRRAAASKNANMRTLPVCGLRTTRSRSANSFFALLIFFFGNAVILLLVYLLGSKF